MKKPNNSTWASALHITLPVALSFVFAILLTSAARSNPKVAFGQSPLVGPTLGNYPGTSLSLSTDTTVTPDAAPTNATSISVSTSTDFNGTLAGDPTTGVVRVTDAHPSGTYTVTVTAFDGGGATATKTFTLTVTTPVTCAEVNFGTAINLSVDNIPYSVAVGDFNGDGNQDLAVANQNQSSDVLSIFLGDGTGNFSPHRDFTAGDFPFSVAVGDFNGDGNQDLVTANSSASTVSILLGDGTGHFSAHKDFATGGDLPISVAVGDFNGDGKQDLVVVDESTGPHNVSILAGDGAGNFGSSRDYTVGHGSNSVAVGDFNGDGNQDLAIANGGNVSILLGDGTGHFGAPSDFAAGDFPKDVVVGDFNGDGNQDLAVTTPGFPGNASILLGDGAGNFGAPTNFAAGDNPRCLAVGDFNGDGYQDLAVGNSVFQLSDTVSILLGDGAGNFGVPTNFAGGELPNSVAVGDFNGDGKQDLAVVNEDSHNVSIFLRECPVSQITPAETTCDEFSSGTAETLGTVQYSGGNHSINRVTPGNFFYWVPVTAPAGENIFRITQAITTGNFNIFFAGSRSKVFNSNCVSLQSTSRQIGDTVTVRFNAPTTNTYFIAINFNADSLIGQHPPIPTTVHYNFTTNDVPDSTSGLDLAKFQSP